MIARRLAGRGFTLLEVLVAVAILGLGLTAILSAQTGLFYTYQRGADMSVAAGLARCRMSELEVELLREGFPLVDELDEGNCCDDESIRRYSCSWAVERVELPPADTSADLFTDGEETPGPSLGAAGGSGQGLQLGALGALTGINQTQGQALGDDPTLSSVGDLLSESGGIGGLEQLVMGMVYPQLKPMLEASIRKVTINVHWKEGSTERKLRVVQYLTNPQQGGFEADDELDEVGGAAAPGGALPGKGG